MIQPLSIGESKKNQKNQNYVRPLFRPHSEGAARTSAKYANVRQARQRPPTSANVRQLPVLGGLADGVNCASKVIVRQNVGVPWPGSKRRFFWVSSVAGAA